MSRASGSLRVKWTLAVLGVAVVPAAILGPLVLGIQRDGLGRAEKELEAAVVDEAASQVLAALDQTADVAQRASTIFADDRIDVEGRTRLLADLVARAPGISGVAFFDGERRFVDAIVPRDHPMDDTVRLPPDPTPGFQMLATPDAAVPRFVVQGAGVTVAVGLARDVLDGKLREISLTRFGAEGRVMLIDESLRVLGGGGLDRRPPRILGSPGAKGRNFATPMIVTTEIGDDVGTLRTMPAQRWALVVERPTEEAFRALASARRAFALSLAGLASLAILAGLFITRRVLGPVSTLMRLVQRYARRDFEARSEVKSGDELEALGGALEHMADDLARSEHEIEARARLEANLRRYLPAEAASAAASLELGGTRRCVTIVFADVVAFTGFAEKTSPERAVAFLNELFTILSEIVFRHRGMVDKFIGDCIMAVFQSSSGAHDDVARALAAAEDMHAFVESNSRRWKDAYAFRVELGIGVARGEVLIGNLGSSSRMEYTVVGDAVNVAARLEALARPRQTLTTRDVVEACPSASFASLGQHSLHGRANAVEVFEVVS